jgi:hypothetical protein
VGGDPGVNSSEDDRHCSVLYICKYFVASGIRYKLIKKRRLCIVLLGPLCRNLSFCFEFMLWCFSAARVSGGKAVLLLAAPAADPPHLSRPPIPPLSKPKNNRPTSPVFPPTITVQKILLSWSPCLLPAAPTV